MSYARFIQEGRYQIYILKKAEYSQAQIAELLKRDKSTISRELRRNRNLRGYRPKQAHAVARCQTKASICIDESVWQQVETLLGEQWGPQQIAGRLKREQGVHISHECISISEVGPGFETVI